MSQRNRASDARRRERTRVLVNKRKDAPCADCGGRFPPECMDFDHVRGEKVLDVSRLLAGAVSIRRVIAEMDKCDLVCSNCHRKRTLARLPPRRPAPLPVPVTRRQRALYGGQGALVWD
jgi:hypothetical protein